MKVVEGWAIGALGNHESGSSEILDTSEVLRMAGTAMLRPFHFAMLADLAIRRDAFEDALNYIDQGISVVEQTEERWSEPELRRLAESPCHDRDSPTSRPRARSWPPPSPSPTATTPTSSPPATTKPRRTRTPATDRSTTTWSTPIPRPTQRPALRHGRRTPHPAGIDNRVTSTAEDCTPCSPWVGWPARRRRRLSGGADVLRLTSSAARPAPKMSVPAAPNSATTSAAG